MNNFQGIMTGKGELEDSYPSATFDALKRRKMNLRNSLAKKSAQVSDVDLSKDLSPPKQSLRPKKAGY